MWIIFSPFLTSSFADCGIQSSHVVVSRASISAVFYKYNKNLIIRLLIKGKTDVLRCTRRFCRILVEIPAAKCSTRGRRAVCWGSCKSLKPPSPTPLEKGLPPEGLPPLWGASTADTANLETRPPANRCSRIQQSPANSDRERVEKSGLKLRPRNELGNPPH